MVGLNWLVGLVSCLVGWLNWFAGWLIGCLLGCLVGLVASLCWLVGWVDWLLVLMVFSELELMIRNSIVLGLFTFMFVDLRRSRHCARRHMGDDVRCKDQARAKMI